MNLNGEMEHIMNGIRSRVKKNISTLKQIRNWTTIYVVGRETVADDDGGLILLLFWSIESSPASDAVSYLSCACGRGANTSVPFSSKNRGPRYN